MGCLYHMCICIKELQIKNSMFVKRKFLKKIVTMN